MHRGYIKLWRRIKDWEWYKDSHTFHLLAHLIMTANYEDSRYCGFDIKRGQVVTGRLKLAEDTGISQQTIRTSLERLKSTNEITIKSTNKFSIITVCNYELYQEGNSDFNQQINQQSNQQLTNNQPTTNQQLTTSKEVKERKEVNTKTRNARARKSRPEPFEPTLPFADREKIFKDAIFENTEYSPDMLKGFFNYWSERAGNDLMKFETMDTWELKKRLSTWALRSKEKGKGNGALRKTYQYEQGVASKYDNLPISQIGDPG